MIGEYRLGEKIAEGGMGAVYTATHPVIGKRAAVKVLLKSLCTSEEVVRRFVDEARAINQIGHSNIVDVFAFGVLPDRRSYFVMEWLDGHTIGQYLAAGSLSMSDAVVVLDQLCAALQAAHEKGIIHRDIKPDNIFLVRERDHLEVKLLDFGVAKLGMQRHPSEASQVLGTPSYISPEQSAASDVDHRTDIYSVGVVAFEIFAGRKPFQAGSVMEMLTMHIHRQPPSPSSINPDIPPAIEQLILQMLAKDPAQRPELSVVREGLGELKSAVMLAGAHEGAPALRGRPVLVRRFDRISDMAGPLIAELSAGVSWVATQGEAPPPGTPIAIQFEAPSLAAQLSCGGIVSRHFGTTTSKSLIRYDRIAKERLDRIFSIVAGVRTASPDKEEIEARWIAPAEEPAETAELPEVPIATEVVDTPEGSLDLPVGEIPKRALIGLGAKVLALTALVTIAAVVAVTYIALERAQEDRLFYVREVNVRTSQLLADALEERVDHWKSRLLVAALGGTDGKFELGAFRSLTICRKTCQTVVGKAPPKEAQERARKEDLLLPIGDHLLVSAHTKNAFAIATVKRSALVDLARVQQDYSVFVIDAGQQVLVSQPPKGSLSPHRALLDDLSAAKKRKTGGRDYQTQEGVTMYGSWARARSRTDVREGWNGLAVLVTVPSSLSRTQLLALTRDVSIVAAAILGLAFVVAIVFARRMTSRLRRLATHASRVSAGDFGASGEVTGRDEVGHVASSFDSMTQSLRQRDRDVLRIQQKMSEDESGALQRQMSEWLETDLASTLNQIHDVATTSVDETDPLADLRKRRGNLELLSDKASASLQHALAFAAIATRRIDFATAVADAVAYGRTAAHGTNVEIDFEAKNAVLFPRLQARESEIRELVQTLVARSAKASNGGRIHVSLALEPDELVLRIAAPRSEAVKEALIKALQVVDSIIVSHEAKAILREHSNSYAVVIGFPVDAKDASAE